MKSLFDPRFLLVAVILLLGTAVFAYQAGKRNEANACAAENSRLNTQAAIELAQAEKDVRDRNYDMRVAVEKENEKRKKEQAHDKATINALLDAISNGGERMYADVVTPVCVSAEGRDAAPGDRETRAELSPAYAKSLVEIAADGDDAIKDLNSCIDRYNEVRKRHDERG